MNKTVSTAQLRKGMYVSDLKCSWINHPFSMNQFLIDSEKDIRKIIQAGIKQVEIDISKGLDVYIAPENTEEQSPPAAPEDSQAAEPQNSSYSNELHHAKVAFAEAGEVITTMMADVKMGRQVELESVNPVINNLCDSILRNQNALLGLSRIRMMDKYTFEHSVSVAVLLMSFAKNMQMDTATIKQMGTGGLLHDIGKTLTPDEILNKPGKLSDKEFAIMRNHVVDSRRILQKTKNLSQIALNVAAQHHERFDGSGYPDGLKGEQISLHGQMAAIVDVYDAITADRCYHKGEEPPVVLKLLMKWSKTHFNPMLVQRFVQTVGIYPAGCLVLLSNNRLAKVIEVVDDLLKPRVETLLDTKKRSYVSPQVVDLSKESDITIVSAESYEKWNLKP